MFAINELFDDKYNKLRRQFLLVSIVILTVVAGLRYETGVDWITYTIMFDQTPSIGTSNFFHILGSLNFGFSILLSLVKTLGGGIQTVFLIVAIISFTFLYKALKIYTPYRNTSLLLYFCLFFFVLDMSGIRQAVALNIFFYSIQYIENRNFKKYMLYTLLAFSFHWTSFLFLPIYFVFNRRFSTKACVIFFVICILFAFFQIRWVVFLLSVIPNIFGDEFHFKILFYTQNSVFATPKIFGFGGIAIFCIFIFLCIYRKKLENQYPYHNIYFNLFLFQIFIYFALFEFGDISARLRLYTFLSMIIVLPYFFYLFKGIGNKIIFFFLVVSYGFLFARPYLLTTEQAIAYTPYQNYIVHKVILNKKSDGRERVKMHEEFFMKKMKMQED